MGVSVAEYYGQRTDIDSPTIVPIEIPAKVGNTILWAGGCAPIY